MLSFNLSQFIQTITLADAQVDVLRLDLLDKDISGNKWFKLKYHLEKAKAENVEMIASFGGVWSNHIAAFSSACYKLELANTIYVRSDEGLTTATLQKAAAQGSIIKYCTRAEYKIIKNQAGLINEVYFIPEGGATKLGVKGASEILQFENVAQYDTVYCCVGTGTTFTGLVAAALPHQKIVGINAVKAEFIPDSNLIPVNSNYSIINNAHFGGFAKYDDVLLAFMNQLYTETKIPTDIVYTGKLFYVVQQLLLEQQQMTTEKRLIIHSGGLQGNLSLAAQTLVWQ